MILHSGQGFVYSSKIFNELLPMYGIKYSMSRAGTPTDNATKEAISSIVKLIPALMVFNFGIFFVHFFDFCAPILLTSAKLKQPEVVN